MDKWWADNLKYFADTFGKENIVAAHLHRDEETPHIHFTLVPIVKGERKRRKREEQTKKLKGAATTAAANIAGSIGFLFGSNKVKTLERENTALHREVATHGEAIETLQTRIQ